MNKIILSLMVCLLPITLFAEESIKDIRKSKELKNLVTDISDGGTLELIPDSGLKSEVLLQINQIKPAVCIEGLFFVEKNTEELNRQELYNAIIEFSTLKGINYFSRTSGKEKLLVEEAYLVDENKKTLKDPQFTELKEKREFQSYFQDTTFDDNYYKVTLLNREDAFSLSMTNETKIKYLLMTLANPGEMTTLLQIIPKEDGFLIYGVTYTMESIPWGLEGKVTSSLFNRIKAMKDWYVSKIK